MSMNSGEALLPVSNQPIYAVLKPRAKDPKPLAWEFVVNDAKELGKLPNYPITHKAMPEGIGVTITDGHNACIASFHGYNAHSRYGRMFYVGSAGKRLGRSYTDRYRKFLSSTFGINVGVNCSPIDVMLQFRPGNTVFASRRGSIPGGTSTVTIGSPSPTGSHE
jgi:hypothetical protein